MDFQICALHLNVIIMFLSLLVIISQHTAEARVYLVRAIDNGTLKSFSDRVTSFGPHFPEGGLMGHHLFADNPDGCISVLPPPSNGTWFAVMSHSSGCFTADKVLKAQAAGYRAAILYMNRTDELPEDVGDIVDDKIRIPSTIVGHSCVQYLLAYEKHPEVNTFIDENNSTKYFWTLVLLGIGGIAIVLLGGSFLVWLINRCCAGDKPIGILSRWKLKRLKVHTYRAGDNFEVCAICLEDYKEGERLRILPCAHAFHCRCVDVWLTENRKTCPLCNKAADSKQKQQSRHVNVHEDDRTPLLDEAELPADDWTNNAASNTGAAENCRVHNPRRNVGVSFAEVHEAPSTHRGRRNYGAVDSKVQDQPSSSLDNCDCVTGNAAGSSSCDSLVRPAKFFIGTPRDSEGGSSIPRTGFAQNAGQQESASSDTESAVLLPKPYCAETDKI